MIALIIFINIFAVVFTFLTVTRIRIDKDKVFSFGDVVYSNDEYSLVRMNRGRRNIMDFVVVEGTLAVNTMVSVIDWEKVHNELFHREGKNWYLFFFRRKLNKVACRRKSICEAVVASGSNKTAKLQLQLQKSIWIADYNGQACILTVAYVENPKPQDELPIEELALCSSKMLSILK